MEVKELIEQATTVYRKGEVIEQKDNVTSIYGYPKADEKPEYQQEVDCYFIVVGVNKKEVEDNQGIVKKWIEENFTNETKEMSYLQAGGLLNSQEYAFRMFAIIEVLELGEVLTPTVMGLIGPLADQMAGQGFITISLKKK